MCFTDDHLIASFQFVIAQNYLTVAVQAYMCFFVSVVNKCNESHVFLCLLSEKLQREREREREREMVMMMMMMNVSFIRLLCPLTHCTY